MIQELPNGLPDELDFSAQMYAQEWQHSVSKIVAKFTVLAFGERHAVEQGYRRLLAGATVDAHKFMLRRNIAKIPWSVEVMADVMRRETREEYQSRRSTFWGPTAVRIRA